MLISGRAAFSNSASQGLKHPFHLFISHFDCKNADTQSFSRLRRFNTVR
jgi:hypothetical protein